MMKKRILSAVLVLVQLAVWLSGGILAAEPSSGTSGPICWDRGIETVFG